MHRNMCIAGMLSVCGLVHTCIIMIRIARKRGEGDKQQ